MKQSTLIFILFITTKILCAQVPPPCVDSLVANPYHTCYLEYNPVCGCDSNTYRNYCFAYNKAGVNYYRQGICGDKIFDIDLVPIPVQQEPFIFSGAFRVPSSCYLFITDVFGAVVFSTTFYTSYSDEIKTFEINTNGFQNGVYALIAVVNGEKKFIKFTKVRD